MTFTIDRSSGVPFYKQLRDLLEDEITRGDRAPGSRLPSESALCQTFELSRSTVRQALQHLELSGLVERHRGQGTFVRSRLSHSPSLNSFSENMRRQGREPSRKHLDMSIEVTPAEVIAELGLSDETAIPAIRLERLLMADSEPIGLALTWLVGDRVFRWWKDVSTEDLDNVSLYDLLSRAGARPKWGAETVRAVPAHNDEKRLLHLKSQAYVLVVNRVGFSDNNEPLEYSRLTFRADRYEYHLQLGTRRA